MAKSCPTCGPVAEQRYVGMRGGRYHRHGAGVETRIVECVACGLLFPNPFPLPSSALYEDPAEYFAAHGLESKIAAYRVLARTLGGPSFLDIGSGRGDFVKAAQLEGFTDVVGVEFSDAFIAFARDKLGVTLVKQIPERAFDVVVLNAVLEHVEDPDALMREVARRKPKRVYIDIPREPHLLTYVGNAIERLRGREAVYNLQPTWPPYHVFGFNPRALSALLRKHGFRVERVRVHASPAIPGGGAKAWVGTQINRVANRVGLASNMNVFAIPR